MGLLVEGAPIPSEHMKEYSMYIRKHGLIQFLNTWKRLKDLKNDELKFGDEIESGVYVVDHKAKTVKLSVRAAEVSC
jgi:glutamate--cysteine ligase catalytic subunit